MTFELTTPTTAELTSVTARSEHHGEEMAPGLSLGLSVVAADAVLDSLCPGLRPLLAVRGVEVVQLGAVCEGWKAYIEHGIDEQAPIVLGGCKVHKFRATAGNDGAISLRMCISTNDVNALSVGLIAMKVRQQIVLRLVAPSIAGQSADRTEAAAHKKQRAQEKAGQTRIDAPRGDTPEAALARSVQAGA